MRPSAGRHAVGVWGPQRACMKWGCVVFSVRACVCVKGAGGGPQRACMHAVCGVWGPQWASMHTCVRWGGGSSVGMHASVCVCGGGGSSAGVHACRYAGRGKHMSDTGVSWGGGAGVR